MTQNPEIEECCRCQFFYVHARTHGGDCRRFPPVYIANEDGNERHKWKHPLVMQHHWCGEFQRKRSQP